MNLPPRLKKVEVTPPLVNVVFAKSPSMVAGVAGCIAN
jgi:hypothetical protein